MDLSILPKAQNHPVLTVSDLDLLDLQEAQELRKNILTRFGIIMEQVESDHEAA